MEPAIQSPRLLGCSTKTPVVSEAGRRKNGTFLPGVSGNPRGRPRAFDDMTELCREHTPAAIATLVSIATSGKSETARVAAACALLDRGYGRPPQAIGAVLRSRNPVEALSDEELDDLLQVIREARAASLTRDETAAACQIGSDVPTSLTRSTENATAPSARRLLTRPTDSSDELVKGTPDVA